MQHPTKDVLITNVELKQFESGSQYKITGNTNTGIMRFKFYDKKKDGSETSAMGQFRALGLKVGDVVNITYEEEQKEYEGKPYTDRRVIWFRESNLPPSALQTTQASSQAESPRGEAPRASKGTSTDAFGRRLGVQGHINALLSNPNVYGAGRVPDIQTVIRTAILIEDEAERQLNGKVESEPTEMNTEVSPARAAMQRGMDKAKAYTEAENITVEDIPF